MPPLSVLQSMVIVSTAVQPVNVTAPRLTDAPKTITACTRTPTAATSVIAPEPICPPVSVTVPESESCSMLVSVTWEKSWLAPPSKLIYVCSAEPIDRLSRDGVVARIGEDIIRCPAGEDVRAAPALNRVWLAAAGDRLRGRCAEDLDLVVGRPVREGPACGREGGVRRRVDHDRIGVAVAGNCDGV